MKFTKFAAGKRIEGIVIRPPVGTIVAYGGSSAPSDWLLCTGTEMLRSSYAELDAVLGTSYGAYTDGSGGAGSTHLRIPNLAGRSVVGAGTGTGLTARTVGESGGVSTVTLAAAQGAAVSHTHTELAAHTHTVSETPHSHNVRYSGGTDAGVAWYLGLLSPLGTGLTDPTGTASAGFTVATTTISTGAAITVAAAAASAAHNNTQPTVVTNFIIRVNP